MRTAADPGDGAEPARQRLGSWKEIAAYFAKDIRTVRRWEAERGLPVRRVRGGERGSVFAYVAELEAWLGEKDSDAETVEAKEPAAWAAAQSGLAENTEPSPAGIRLGPAWAGALPAAADRRTGTERRAGRWPGLPVLLAVAGLVLVAIVLLRHLPAVTGHRLAPAAAATVRAPDGATADLYLRGRYLWSLRTEDSLTQAVDLFTQAIVHDPHYAAAYAGLADSYLMLRQYGHMTDAEAYRRAYFASRRALALDDSSAEAHRSYAFVLDHWVWNFPAAEAEYRRAIALDRRDAESHHWYATSLLSAGRFADALREIERARQLQPESVVILANRGLILKFTDEPAALSSLLELEQTNPKFASVHIYLALIRFDMGQYDEFLSEARQSAGLLDRPAEIAVLDEARKELTQRGERAMLLALAEGYGRLAENPQDPHAMMAALYFAELRNPERTLHYLEISCARRESNFQAIPHEPEYGFLHGNPRFEALLQRSRTPLEVPAEPAEDDVIASAAV